MVRSTSLEPTALRVEVKIYREPQSTITEQCATSPIFTEISPPISLPHSLLIWLVNTITPFVVLNETTLVLVSSLTLSSDMDITMSLDIDQYRIVLSLVGPKSKNTMPIQNMGGPQTK